MHVALRLCLLVTLLWPLACHAAWFEVVGAQTRAHAELQIEGGGRNVTLCDGDAANLTITVSGGTPPWKVALMRNDELYTRLIVKQQSWWPSSSSYKAKLSLPLPGRYSLARVCDTGGCNGTVDEQAVVVSLARLPTARIQPQTPVCMDDSTSGYVFCYELHGFTFPFVLSHHILTHIFFVCALDPPLWQVGYDVEYDKSERVENRCSGNATNRRTVRARWTSARKAQPPEMGRCR